jgi:hypothetical protein
VLGCGEAEIELGLGLGLGPAAPPAFAAEAFVGPITGTTAGGGALPLSPL